MKYLALNIPWQRSLAAAAIVATLVGCGAAEPSLAEVHGTVRLDGKPLANAMLEFNPEQGDTSYGTTNEAGKYRLRFDRKRAGAVIGKHKVRITTEEESRVRLASRYHEETELVENVAPGTNRIDFELKSK